jgi:hypothetical protein
MKHDFFVAHWHIVDVKAEKCSTITNLKKIYFQCKKHIHKVSYPRVATAYKLFNKILVYNNLKLHTWIYQLTPVFLSETLYRTWLSSHNFWSSSSRCTEFAISSNVVFGRSTVCLYFPSSCFSPSKSKQAKLNSTTLFLTIKPGLITKVEIKQSNINRLLHFLSKKTNQIKITGITKQCSTLYMKLQIFKCSDIQIIWNSSDFRQKVTLI